MKPNRIGLPGLSAIPLSTIKSGHSYNNSNSYVEPLLDGFDEKQEEEEKKYTRPPAPSQSFSASVGPIEPQPQEAYKDTSIVPELIRICAISIFLSVGYAINTITILQAIITNKQYGEAWAVAYVSSSIYLSISCVMMVIVTCCGVKIKLFSKYKRYFAIFSFVVGAGVHITSLLLAFLLKDDNKYICWQHEVLYSLLPLYLACLIFFFDSKKFTHLIILILFSLMLFVTPFLQLLVIIIAKPKVLPLHKMSPYLSFCAATSILISLHIILLAKHYNSGLFLKLCIVTLLTYSIVLQIRSKIIFDGHDTVYTIYYCILLAAVCIIYCCELFLVKGAKNIVLVDAKSLARNPSFNLQVETMESIMSDLENEQNIRSIVDLVRPSEKIPLSALTPVFSVLGRTNPNEDIDSVIKIFPDFKPCAENGDKYFNEFSINESEKIDRFTDSIAAIVPFYNEKAAEIHATLRSLYFNFDYIKRKKTKYKFTHFNVLLVGDGWFKADISTKRYLAKLYNCCTNDLEQQRGQSKHNTVILQTKFNRKLCINPFKNEEKKLFLKVTAIIKIDNRKKANSHEWFLGRYGFAEWCKCDYMFFTDAYSTMNREGLYRMLVHMKKPKNADVVCCTGRARVYSIEQELDLQNLLREKNVEKAQLDEDDNKYQSVAWWKNDIFKDEKNTDIFKDDSGKTDEVFYKIQDSELDHRLTTNSHLRSCQMFEFEALYGTIGCYLLGGFLPVIPGPCGFYRSSVLLMDEVRGWYFEKINQKNDPENMDLVLGNMKLAEDRILTISSILNSEFPVRHSLIAECIFYFDPQPNLAQLMKQRRRWLNGSIATVIFVLRKISFQRWKVNPVRRFYVLSLWYMQLLMYIVVALSPPLIFIISFEFGLATILDVILVDHNDGTKEKKIETTIITLMVTSWAMYLIFIFFAQRDRNARSRWIKIKKETVVQLTLVVSYSFGLLTLMGTFIQVINVLRPQKKQKSLGVVATSFSLIVMVIQMTFFLQSFVLAPLVSKDIKTLHILITTCFHYFLYGPFYVSFFFINALANIHDLSWGTRPDKEADSEYDANNPKATTTKLLLTVIFIDALLALTVIPLTEYIYANIVFFGVLVFPSLYQIFFSFIWLTNERFYDLWRICKPKKMSEKFQYVGLSM